MKIALRITLVLVLSWLLLATDLVSSLATVSPGGLGMPDAAGRQASPNLLINGDFEQLPFYWKFPNHYVAGGWSRWWIEGTFIPEYDDARTRPIFEGAHAQIYHKWFGGELAYRAGIYQVVEAVTPCVPYRFTMWGRNHAMAGVNPHGQIGLDPTGVALTPNQDVGSIIALPDTITWSEEQTQLGVWEQLSVQAEAVTDRIMAVTYAAPEGPPVFGGQFADTFWDAGELIEMSFPGNRLPSPQSPGASPFIQNITTTFSEGRLTITWQTATPASTQVLYSAVPGVVTPIEPLTQTVYLPLLHMPDRIPDLSTQPVQHHRYEIAPLRSGDVVYFEALSRYSDGTRCITASSGPQQVTLEGNQAILSVPAGSIQTATLP